MVINSSIKSTLSNPELSSIFKRRQVAAFFHSTPVLERRRRSQWETKNSYTRRFRSQQWKHSVLFDMNAFAERLFHGWQPDSDSDSDGQPHSGPSWFSRQEWDDESSRHRRYNPRGQSKSKRRFHFCDDDFEVETVFRSAFGGDRFTFWSFIDDDEPRSQGWSSHGNGHRHSWRHAYQSEEEYDSSESDSSYRTRSDLASERLTLGLSASGPLRLEEVKNAYRACALKWHPDRHHGSSKGVAEEKFKHCSAAYQSLCDKLEMA
ncbi:hypothetical protein Droror1_Dr00002495 [Drosera rotundifolia]